MNYIQHATLVMDYELNIQYYNLRDYSWKVGIEILIFCFLN